MLSPTSPSYLDDCSWSSCRVVDGLAVGVVAARLQGRLRRPAVHRRALGQVWWRHLSQPRVTPNRATKDVHGITDFFKHLL